MFHVTPPPRDSDLRLRHTDDGPVVWWNAYPHERFMALLAAVGIGFFGVLGGLGLVARFVLSGATYWEHAAAIALVVLSLVSLVLCVRLRAHLVESLAFTDATIVYGRPAPPRIVWRLFGWDDTTQTLDACLALDRFVIRAIGDWKKMWPRNELVTLERDDVSDVRIEGRGKFGHVTIAVGNADLDIGKRLSNDEREWVLAVLERWREG